MNTEQFLSENKVKIEKIVLTDEEIKEAIFEGKKRKYFHVKHKPYWDEQQSNTHSIIQSIKSE